MLSPAMSTNENGNRARYSAMRAATSCCGRQPRPLSPMTANFTDARATGSARTPGIAHGEFPNADGIFARLGSGAPNSRVTATDHRRAQQNSAWSRMTARLRMQNAAVAEPAPPAHGRPRQQRTQMNYLGRTGAIVPLPARWRRGLPPACARAPGRGRAALTRAKLYRKTYSATTTRSGSGWGQSTHETQLWPGCTDAGCWLCEYTYL